MCGDEREFCGTVRVVAGGLLVVRLMQTMGNGSVLFRSAVWSLLNFVVLCALQEVEAEVVSSETTCKDLGFTGLALCSDCDSLREYVKDEELEADCRKCCTEESKNALSKVTYAGAVLEICFRQLMFYPDIQIFIEERLSHFPKVDVRYRFGAAPKLIMKDRKGKHKETIRIDNWKRQQIEQFLTQKVISKASL